MQRIAIIGAGLSGTVLAQKLSKKAEVVIFEKAGGLGGRMSTRYAERFVFDHGTQYFTARTQAFQTFLKSYEALGVVAPWMGTMVNLHAYQSPTPFLVNEPHWVATPNMNSLCKTLAKGLTIHTRCEVAPLGRKSGEGWELYDKEGQILGYFDWVISTAPCHQTQNLFDTYLLKTEGLRLVNMKSCYTLMVGFNTLWRQTWRAAKIHHEPLQWIGVNSTKPGRDNNVTCLVAHSSHEWAKTHIDEEMASVQTSLSLILNDIVGVNSKKADYVSLHFWRYASVDVNTESVYCNAKDQLAATSDWCKGSRIETVWFHANILADHILTKL